MTDNNAGENITFSQPIKPRTFLALEPIILYHLKNSFKRPVLLDILYAVGCRTKTEIIEVFLLLQGVESLSHLVSLVLFRQLTGSRGSGAIPQHRISPEGKETQHTWFPYFSSHNLNCSACYRQRRGCFVGWKVWLEYVAL